MLRTIARSAGLMAVAASVMLADFSYQETTKITGGSLIAALKMAGVFSKQARQLGEPQQSTVAVKGDRMVHRGQQHLSVIDLASETITTVDFQRKTYSVMTFAQLKQMMEQMSEKMQQQQQQKNAQGEYSFKVSANNTGATRQISGYDARETVLKMEMQGTDQKSGQSGSLVITADTWIAPSVPGYDEVRRFYRRMAEKINWTPGGNLFMSRPDVMQGMAEVYKESAKLNGMPVLQTMTMGADGTVPSDGSASQPPQQQQTTAQPTVGSALGSAIGGKFGLGRKKAQPQQDSQPTAQGGSQASGTLIETTTEMSGFSSDAVDASLFDIPAGFKQVDPESRRK
ncbi:MAG TPA: hypothetical protein VKU19_14205 [Bryobacteraceae bacterium]|nr:hypothetical protein [Bryobacteraceae bacterium]